MFNLGGPGFEYTASLYKSMRHGDSANATGQRMLFEWLSFKKQYNSDLRVFFRDL